MSRWTRKSPRTREEILGGRNRCALVERELRYARERNKKYFLHGTVIDGGWVPAPVLERLAGWRFSARLHQLKAEGRIQYEKERWTDPRTGRITNVYLYRATRFAPLASVANS